MDSIRQRHQVLIIGAGLAGCSAALELADAGLEVCLLTTSSELDGGNSALAQGGIIYPELNDSSLEEDIMIAGHNYNSKEAVQFLSQNGHFAVKELLLERLKVPFAKADNNDDFDRTLEGGHSKARILHCADYTGRAIMQKLQEAVEESPKIKVLKSRTLVDLITTEHHAKLADYRYNLDNHCIGAYIFNEENSKVETHFSDYTVLATGGVGQLFLHSTNSANAIGAGIAVAYRTGGIRLTNLEFVQFHPTTFYHRYSPRFLLTEALRGEGAKLVNVDNEDFMTNYDPRGDLAPRDVVACSIVAEMLRTQHDCVYLDTKKIKGDLTKRFPTVYKSCLKEGVDITNSKIPVVPAAHYFCGGILVDHNARTTLDRLYAIGEVSCTGIHGANRLASTSLLECIVWGRSLASSIMQNQKDNYFLSDKVLNSVSDWQVSGSEHNDDPALITQDWTTIKNTMWNYVGIIRTEARLKRAFQDLRDVTRQVYDFYHNTPLSKPLLNLFHGSQAAYAITQAALNNRQSLGCHNRKN